ncbi:hypothetical protein [Azospirillum picis]|uniref:Transposase n=1 Tax=Azospirillum picis TaxID=488438 RepID=A0ABU0MSB4_9PROT|nr:hypothetical protein [Azospirillum picis]MBP2301932.1 hypothetical protein [Azospirillum picis]MDQ0536381.1 hypothetical protein [Azospirillum picis]
MTAALHLIRLPADVRAPSRRAAERRLGQTEGGGFDDGRALHQRPPTLFGLGSQRDRAWVDQIFEIP